MNKFEREELWKKILAKGDSLRGKLPPHKSHTVRNPYVHVCSEIKKKYKKSYKDISSKYYRDVTEFIKRID